ncbi:MAG TPA: RNA 2',3'-cyclic phosphodiesterase [Phycisphaerae bacterium]|jgi:2'-5' RNA ligase|nr:RNA 2',3'-cyclic phosphodiesterase [Phycisphaerae bacterium]HOB76446.1 RNA 2',3'-cyclic phosphodiesterase [Phycisphaerae bacterium]HOJ56712.1 RNA 2',3'-cyclic phosphodiesterase [Phycisphaerae bacterium]HOL28492.1 RNA 2',3'-cyclic phosphodiesterase [Phycisphaerae bacterium]HPP23006.1 RNA 2',3'-cyclic phosphodiesterase [Phycisphaerae bacterium]
MRCFVAIELPDDVRACLADLQRQMAGLGRGVRWTRPESIHLTVKFLGEVPDAQVAEVCEAARRIARKYPVFDLAVAGTGCFPPRGPARVIWAGIPQLPQPLIDCQRECEDVYAGMGFEKENRAYRPHLTVGRVNDPGLSNRIRETLRQFEHFSGGDFAAGELVVFQSELRRGGSLYTPLARAPLNGS